MNQFKNHKEKEDIQKNNSNKVRNIIGIFFAVFGLIGMFSTNILAGLCMTFFGATLTTYFDLILHHFNFSINKATRICIPIVFIFGIGIFAPPSEPTNNRTMDSTNVNTVVETETPTAKPTKAPIPTATPSLPSTAGPTNIPVEVDSSIATIADSQQATVWADACDLSGYREPNAIVDIGYGDRVYWAYTNEYGQLIKITADEIILQTTEEENSNGRYCSDEAKVPGTEDSDLDEGHIIADSLGGVSNAYNITPQNSTLNRHGDQAYMEKTIRDAGGATNFVAEITYPNTETQIPSHYKYTYTVWGNVVVDEFDNVNPEDTVPNGNGNNNSDNSTSNGSSNNSNNYIASQQPTQEPNYNVPQGNMVWKSATGSKYHSINNCGKMNPAKATQLTEDDAIAQGLRRCSKCW